MIIKEAGQENSGLADKEHGRAIFVSTTARAYFRKAYPAYSKVRNNIMNQFIAKMFSEGRIVDYFKPKGSESEEVGEIREVGGGKFAAIIAGDHVRVISVKGSPSGLPALPQSKVPGAVEMGLPGSESVSKALEGGT